jgi:stress response protein YsnF
MHGQCLVAVYPSRSEAEQALRAAVGSGIPSGNIRISGADTERHVWDWLFDSNYVPERDKAYYRAHHAEGRTALSVQLDGGASPARIDAVEQILERYHPVDVHVETEGEGSIASGQAVKAGPVARATTGEEQIIPLPKEELKVGIRAADRVRYIRTYVIEEPVEKEVSLSDEEVIIEKRPATRTAAAAGDISERAYEFHERHEEPVVEKTTLADEELVVRKEAKQHTERVRGTVRRTGVKTEEVGVAAKERGRP